MASSCLSKLSPFWLPSVVVSWPLGSFWVVSSWSEGSFSLPFVVLLSSVLTVVSSSEKLSFGVSSSWTCPSVVSSCTLVSSWPEGSLSWPPLKTPMLSPSVVVSSWNLESSWPVGSLSWPPLNSPMLRPLVVVSSPSCAPWLSLVSCSPNLSVVVLTIVSSSEKSSVGTSFTVSVSSVEPCVESSSALVVLSVSSLSLSSFELFSVRISFRLGVPVP